MMVSLGFLIAIGGLAVPPTSDVNWQVSTECPTAEELQARLAPLVAPLPGARKSYVVRIANAASGVAIELSDERGVLARRTVAPRRCDQMAELVAVIVAAWRIELESDVGAAPTLLAPPEPSGAVGELSVLFATRAPTGTDDLGAGAALAFALFPRRWSFGPRLAIEATVPSRREFASGLARWQRLGGELSAEARRGRGRTSLLVRGGFEATWLRAWGEGFADDATAGAFQPAARLALGVATRLGPVVLQLAVGGRLWVNRQVLVVTPAPVAPIERLALPRAEATLEGGVGYAWR